MPIPPLDSRGLLPEGVHRASLEDVPVQFCCNPYRWHLWDDVLRGLDTLCALAHDPPLPALSLVLGGSFFSDKPDPADIEVTLVLPAGTPAEVCWLWTLRQVRLHPTLKTENRMDYYVTLPGHNDFARFFQYVGPKTAAVKRLLPMDLRGVVEVTHW